MVGGDMQKASVERMQEVASQLTCLPFVPLFLSSTPEE